ncbi:hypothetical protein FRC12_000240 [Ceratobasidium sp. 428]|nr:hypothetical protein FRC12_000240 [Ceratobasidium sp. 428]
MNSAQNQALATPDLLYCIFDALSHGQIAQVLGVNQLFFRVGTPAIWGSLKGLEPLFSLLRFNSLPPLPANSWVVVSLNKDEVKAGMPRFMLYACLVQKVQAYRNSSRGYRWRGLCHLDPYTPLLPHMRELSIKWRSDRAHSAGFGDLVSLLCGNECTTIRAHSYADCSIPWMTTIHSSRALAALQNCATSLTTLDFFVKADVPSLDEWALLATCLQDMKALSCLGLGVDTLSKQVLAALGQLPSLRLLTMRFHQLARIDLQDLKIPSSWFQQLNSLAIYSVSAENLFYLLRQRPLISGLQSLFLDITAGSRIDHHLEQVLQILCSHAPGLHTLEICFPDRGEDAYEVQSQDLMPILSRLPLKKLALQNVYISDDETFETFILGCMTWRNSMTHFLMPCQIVTPFGLQALARFSALKVLSVNLDEDSPIPGVDFTEPPINPGTLRLESHFLLSQMLPDEVEALAWFLLSCWDDVTPAMTRLPLDQAEQKDRLDYWVYHGLLCKLAEIKRRKPSEDTATWR